VEQTGSRERGRWRGNVLLSLPTSCVFSVRGSFVQLLSFACEGQSVVRRSGKIEKRLLQLFFFFFPAAVRPLLCAAAIQFHSVFEQQQTLLMAIHRSRAGKRGRASGILFFSHETLSMEGRPIFQKPGHTLTAECERKRQTLTPCYVLLHLV
jgi:hypothetical protein